MIIYRWYNVFLMIYGTFYGYENLHENTKVISWAIATAVLVWVVLEFFLSFGLYRMGKKRKIGKYFMAFIPLVNMLYAGKLAGDGEFFGQKMKHIGVFVMVTRTLLFLVGAFTIFVETSLYMNYVPTVMNNTLIFLKTNGSEPTGKLARFFIGYDNISTMLLSILELAYTVLLFILASSLFRQYAPSSSMFLAFLSLFIPVSFPIVVFVLRNKKPINYAEYIRKKREAYYNRYGGGGYTGNPYGGGSMYGSGSYGTRNDDTAANNQKPSSDPFSEFGSSGDGKSDSKKNSDSTNDSPFSDIDG